MYDFNFILQWEMYVYVYVLLNIEQLNKSLVINNNVFSVVTNIKIFY